LNLSDPDRSERADLRSSEPRAGARRNVTFSNVSAARTNVLTGACRLENLDSIAVVNDSFQGNDGVGPNRHRGAGRDPSRCARRKRL
jgi:hypothetical protein